MENLNHLRGRPKLIKFQLKKNRSKWTFRNLETGQIYYLKINELNPEPSLHRFLQSINAYDEYSMPRTSGKVDYRGIIMDILDGKFIHLWIPSNKIKKLKDAYIIDNFITFREFLKQDFSFKNSSEKYLDLLCESFVPKRVSFGTDLENGLWGEKNHTFCEIDEKVFVVKVSKNGEIFFKQYYREDPFDYLNYEGGRNIDNDFTDKPKSIVNALGVFNKIFYVVKQYIENNNLDRFSFFGANYDLIKFYGGLVQDKSFLKSVDTMGYEYKGVFKKDGYIEPNHVFRRK